MTHFDWAILTAYITLIIFMSWYIGRRQFSQADYYLGGRKMPAWQISLSIMATQVSAISLIGAPAFIAVKADGGLIWLQYEFAIPLAMLVMIIFLIPTYRKLNGITIYEFLEIRFGVKLRSFVGAVFLISRGLGTGVALFATGIITAVCLDWPLADTILLIGVVSIIYTTFGGIKADIYSDIIQLFILWGSSIILIIFLIYSQDTAWISSALIDNNRTRVLDFNYTGLGDGKTFSFWPMLIGGLFLYVSYYGCDQSQAQRLLATPSVTATRKALLWNGLLRFPLVLTYSVIGLLLIPFIKMNPELLQKVTATQPDFLVPYFLTDYIPKGFLGIIVSGLFAASMSSIDSALNSLSAVTYQDFLVQYFPKWSGKNAKRKIVISRLFTIIWGIIATLFSLTLIGGAETVIEMVNKIGSAFYGPVLAVFLVGILSHRATETSAISGLFAGVLTNIYLWLFWSPEISWMWWNVFGFSTTLIINGSISKLQKSAISGQIRSVSFRPINKEVRGYVLKLSTAFIVFVLISAIIHLFFIN